MIYIHDHSKHINASLPRLIIWRGIMSTINKKYIEQDFLHHDFTAMHFEKCDFYKCNFSKSNLSDATFVDCNFIEPNDIEGCQFDYACMRDTSFKRCRMSMSSFIVANCLGIEFKSCDLKGTNFAKASFENQISRQVYFCSAFITGCNLSYANFSRVRLEKCDLFENRWSGANLQGASLTGSDLSRSEFSKDAWEQFQMQNCNLAHTELDGLNIKRVKLDGVKICSWQQEQLLDSLGIIVLPD